MISARQHQIYKNLKHIRSTTTATSNSNFYKASQASTYYYDYNMIGGSILYILAKDKRLSKD